MTSPGVCHICRTPLTSVQDVGLRLFACPRCGLWSALPPKPGDTTHTISEALGPDGLVQQHRRARLSHLVRRQQGAGKTVGVPVGVISSWGLDSPLPSPAEQLDSIIMWVGWRQPDYITKVRLVSDEVAAFIGAPLAYNGSTVPLGWLLNQERIKALVDIDNTTGALRLTLDGWARYETLRQTGVEAKAAFMAMKFDDEQLDGVVEAWFKPAIAETGFELRKLNENQPAGCIDDQMRVALRRAKFVVSDLTHKNNGAYWEAGFAEGASKPVIYTCRKDVWAKERTHFDTNHLATVIWDQDNLGDAAARLKAMVRATFPGEAILD